MINDYHMVTKWYDKVLKSTFTFWESDKGNKAMVIIMPKYIVRYFGSIEKAMLWARKLREL